MTTLRVDTGTVRSLADNITLVHSHLTDADATSRVVAEAVGHAGLSDTLGSFSGKWDDRRRELCDQITGLRDAATGIADAFEHADSELANALADRGDA